MGSDQPERLPTGGTRPPRRRENWQTVLYASFAAQLISMIGFNSSIPFVPLFLQKDLNVHDVGQAGLWSGIMVTASFLTMAAFSPIWGSLSDRYGRKSMVLRSILGGVVVVGLMAFTQDVWFMLVLRIMQGALTGTVTANIALVASITPKEKMGYALGLMQTSVFVGASIGPLVGGILSDLTDYRVTFIITAVILTFAALIVVFLVHEDFTPVKPDPTRQQLSLGQRFKAAFMSKEFMALVIILALVQFSSSIIAPVLALFIKVLNGGGSEGVATLAGLELAITGVTSAFSAVVAGRLSDKYGHRQILIISALAAALLYIPQALVGNVWELLILRGLMGLCFGGIIPSANALIAQMIPEGRKGSAFGVVSSVSSLGSASGPLIGAVIAAAISTRAVFLLTGFTLLMAALWIKTSLPRTAVQAEPGPAAEEVRSPGSAL